MEQLIERIQISAVLFVKAKEGLHMGSDKMSFKTSYRQKDLLTEMCY